MTVSHPIQQRWPAQHPERLQLYSLPTPNGVKVSIMLEEMGLPYEAHTVRIDDAHADQFTPEFLALNPNNKIPAIWDPNGPRDAQGRSQPLGLFETGAILVYLAEHYPERATLAGGPLLSTEPLARYQTLQWLMWQMGGVGPMFGQLGYFHVFGGKDLDDKRPRDRYAQESHRLLRVLDRQLQGRDWVTGATYTVADIAIWPWVRNLLERYQAADLVGYAECTEVQRVLATFLARPAVQRGLAVPGR